MKQIKIRPERHIFYSSDWLLRFHSHPLLNAWPHGAYIWVVSTWICLFLCRLGTTFPDGSGTIFLEALQNGEMLIVEQTNRVKATQAGAPSLAHVGARLIPHTTYIYLYLYIVHFSMNRKENVTIYTALPFSYNLLLQHNIRERVVIEHLQTMTISV